MYFRNIISKKDLSSKLCTLYKLKPVHFLYIFIRIMMNKILLILVLLSIGLFADFKTLNANKFAKLKARGHLVIDIRTPCEWRQTGIIKGARKLMFFTPEGEADLAGWFFELGRLVKNKKQPILIYCAHASRTKYLGQMLIQEGFKNIYELEGGIENGWIRAGRKTVKVK